MTSHDHLPVVDVPWLAIACGAIIWCAFALIGMWVAVL